MYWCPTGVTDAGLKPRPIRRIAVLGGGLMGSGIATACILVGIEVLLKEINQKFLDVRCLYSNHVLYNKPEIFIYPLPLNQQL